MEVDASHGHSFEVERVAAYQRQRDSVQHLVFNDLKRLESQLAQLHAREMLKLGVTDQMIRPLLTALRLAFGMA